MPICLHLLDHYLASGNTNAAPCTDFFSFACGKAKGTSNSFQALADENKSRLRRILGKECRAKILCENGWLNLEPSWFPNLCGCGRAGPPSLVGFQNIGDVCISLTVPFTLIPPLIHLFQSLTLSLSKSHSLFLPIYLWLLHSLQVLPFTKNHIICYLSYIFKFCPMLGIFPTNIFSRAFAL